MSRAIKRLMDVVGAALLLVLLAPLLLALSLRVLCHLGWPVVFRQPRIGRHEQVFRIVKFRTMRLGDGEDATRLTPFGEDLRASSLDELPELWNVLRGEMSLVGPRPLLPEYLPYYTKREATRHQVRPGITGLAQVSGRNGLSWEERLELDARYVEHWSLWQDIRILWQTLATVKSRVGVSAAGHATMPRLDEVRAASFKKENP